ncbi:serine protease SohB [Rubricella aquisinus]|uniref:Serine protease SohB n=1 Tax=Rubricella aquisinus TaxID=2028108 RepID=A0A840X270_9RHOB|nr:S49 family peptidase [Rubricella aquisinus]MBB5516904.1 serine protease SohB [Rubricella aquisinus]
MKQFPIPARLRHVRKPVVPVIRLQGAIGAMGRAGLSDARLAPVIERAFRKGKPAAVALNINSPGGSPVQSALIAARIRRLADELDMPVHAFCEDIAASGGYWLACAGDDIHVDPSTMIGSIGVISSGFGFQELIAQYGIERRVHTSGKQKNKLDPFLPEQAEDVDWLLGMQSTIHENFKAHVRARRGDRLKGDEEDLFNAQVWIGQAAVDNGIADGIGHLVPVLKDRYGDKVRIITSAPKKGLFQKLGLPGADAVVSAVEERALWQRYGL